MLRRQALIPREILAQDAVSINAYLNNLSRAEKALNRVRVIFMGHGAAGKTSLVRCLHREEVIEEKEAMTPGIEIREWNLPDSDICAHFWDFGGQVIAHATHQFFLRSQCLYVLVMDSRAEIHANEQAQYWLEHVKAFAGNAPVMLVGNKADRVRINLNMESLKERYPNIVGFYSICCTQYQNDFRAEFAIFERDFIKQIQNLDLHQVRFLDQHFQAMESLRKQSRQQAFLAEIEFERVCEQSGVHKNSELNQLWLLDTLDKLGVIIHFPDLAFHDAYVLNPRWLTYGVYTLLYSKQAQDRGELTIKQAIEILQQKKVENEQGHVLEYPKDKCGFIVEAMQRFKLCYFLEQNRARIVIPNLLAPNQPRLDFDRKNPAIAFEFRFTHLLPRHVLPAFIVSRHHEIDRQQVWQTGVLLKNPVHSASALIIVNYSDRVISIQVQGKGASEYLHILHDEILAILANLQDIEYEERLALPKSAVKGVARPGGLNEKGDYRQMLAMLREAQRSYISSSGTRYDLFKILGGVMTDEKLKQEAGDRFEIHNGNVVINRGTMSHTAVGDRVQIVQSAEVLAAEVRELIGMIKVELQHSEGRDKALRELESLRDEFNAVARGKPSEQEEAAAGLKQWAENIKNGVGYAVTVTEGLSNIAGKLLGLGNKITTLLKLLAF